MTRVSRRVLGAREDFMAYMLLAIGALMSVAGVYSIITGSHIVQVEEGWTSVIAGATLFAGGVVTMALGLVLRVLTQLRAAMSAPATSTLVSDPAQVPRLPEVPLSPELPYVPPMPELPQVSATPIVSDAVEVSDLVHGAADVRAPDETQTPPALEPVPSPPPAAPMVKAPAPPVVRLPLKLEPKISLWRRSKEPTPPQIPPTMSPAPVNEIVSSAPVRVPASPPKLPNPPAETPLETPPSDDYKLETPSTPEHDLDVRLPRVTPSTAEPEMSPPTEDWLDRAFAEFDQDFPKGEVAKTSVSGTLLETSPQAKTVHSPTMPAPEPADVEPEPAIPAAEVSPPLPPEPVAPPPPPAGPAAAVIGRYESDGTSYVMYADGSIEAHSDNGVYRFASMAELKAFIES